MAKHRSNGETGSQPAEDRSKPKRPGGRKATASSAKGAAAKPAPGRKAPAPSARHPSHGVGGVLATAVIVALFVAVGYLAWPRVKSQLDAYLRPAPAPAPEAPALGPPVAGLETRIAALEAALASAEPADPAATDDLVAWFDSLAEKVAALNGRIATLEARLEQAPALAPDLAPLAARVDDVEARLAATASDDEAAAAALAERVAALMAAVEGRVAVLEEQAAGSSAARPAMLLAVGQLRAALRGSGPYRAEFDALAVVAGDDAGVSDALAALAGRADVGVPTRAVLRARFATIAAAAVRAAYAPDDGTWVDRTVARLGQLVTWRRVGDVAGDSAEAVVARAEARLEGGDLAAAVAEVARLEGASAEVAGAWLADARARLAAERALAALEARALAALAAANGGG